MKASVIICAYTLERWQDIQKAIASVRSQTYPTHELILIIDHNEELLDKSRRAFPDLTIQPNSQKRGLSGARNTAASIATGDIIIYLDDDAIADSDWLSELVKAYKDENVVATGGKTLAAWKANKPQWFPEEFYWVIGCSYIGVPKEMAEMRNLFGGNMSIKRSVLVASGGYNDSLGRIDKVPLGGEETELCIRIKSQKPKAKFIYTPKAIIYHSIPESRGKAKYFFDRCYAEGLSKAAIKKLSDDKLSSEWSYTLGVLPLGVLRGLKDFVSGDYPGILRAGAIVLGLLNTVRGYVRGLFVSSKGKQSLGFKETTKA